MGYVTSISVQKGGLGKTTVCRNLGEEVSETGRKVLLVDNDPQGNLTGAIFGDDLPEEIMKVTSSVTIEQKEVVPGIGNTCFMYKKNEIPVPVKINDNLYIIGTTKHLAAVGGGDIESVYEFKETMAILADSFDDVFIDCPPAAGILQTSAHSASDYLIIPTSLDEDGIGGMREQLISFRTNKSRLNNKLEVMGVLVNGKDAHKINIEEIYYEQLQYEFSDLLFNTIITHSVKISESRSFNKTVKQHAPNSVQAVQFVALTEEYFQRRGV